MHNSLIIEQADVHYGIVDKKPKLHQLERDITFNNNIDYSKMQNVNSQQINQNGKGKGNVPNEPLISGSGFCKIGSGMAAMQVILLTVNHFADVPIKNIIKLKIYKKSQIQNQYTLKISQSQTNQKIFSFPTKQCYHFSYSCLWAKLLSMKIQVDMQQDFINCCEGEVFKKATVLKTWEPRYLLITHKDGLLCYKNKGEEASNHIQAISQFWTRFQLIENNKFIVFKFWHSLVKYQIGVPIYRCVKWFKAFFALLNR